MIKSVLVVGAGTAGLLAALNLKVKLPQLQVAVLNFRPGDDQEPPGYSADSAFFGHLHGELGLPLGWFIASAKPTLKLGTRYHWGPRPWFDHTYAYQLDTQYAALEKVTGYYCEPGGMDDTGMSTALMSHDRALARMPDGKVRVVQKELGYHVDRRRLDAALEYAARQVGVAFIAGTPGQVFPGAEGVAAIALTTGPKVMADLYVDASGAASVLLGQALEERRISYSAASPMDRMLVASLERGGRPVKPYTTIDTLSSGFSFQFEHPERVDVGYVFSSAHQETQRAMDELAERCTGVMQARVIGVKPGRYERAWVGNVVAVGDASAMVEPLSGSALGALSHWCGWLAQTLVECDGEPTANLAHHYNRRHLRLWDTIRDFHAILYRFNTRLETPLWQWCRENIALGDAEGIVKCHQEAGPSTMYRYTYLRQEDPIGMEGYLDVLVGMQLPYAAQFAPTEAERTSWRKIRDSLRVMGRNGLTMGEALAHMAALKPVMVSNAGAGGAAVFR